MRLFQRDVQHFIHTSDITKRNSNVHSWNYCSRVTWIDCNKNSPIRIPYLGVCQKGADMIFFFTIVTSRTRDLWAGTEKASLATILFF